MKYRSMVVYTLLGVGASAATFAQTPPASGSTEAPPAASAMKGTMSASLSPQEFVTKAGMDGMAEVQLAQLAVKQAQSAEVKQFAQQMIADHGKANAELTAIAKRKNLQVPAALDSEHQDMMQMLGAKSGAAFDAAYAKEMAGAHDKAIALFKRASSSSDADIAGFAKKTLPTLEMHKQMVQKLAAKMGAQ